MSDNPHQQGEWLVQRIGNVTASNAWKVLDRTAKGSPTAKRKEYLIDIVTQRLTGQQTPTFVNSAMQWGIDQEGFARDAYVAKTGYAVDLVGFVKHPTLAAGASPDGLVGMEGAVEFKCPSSTRHAETLITGMPADHLPQIHMQMWICGLQWVDFCSYDPRFPREYSLYVQRVMRDETYLNLLQAEVIVFLSEVDETIKKLKESCK